MQISMLNWLNYSPMEIELFFWVDKTRPSCLLCGTLWIFNFQ